MKTRVAAAILFCFGLIFCFDLSGAQAMEAGPWVTFKLGHNSRGQLEHQIDQSSVKQEGRYKSFWTRIWVTREKQAMAFSSNEQLFFWSQKFLVDCPGQRFGTDFVDSVEPKEAKKSANEKTMHWASLDKFPAIAKSVCGGKSR